MTPVPFLATMPHYVAHLAPVWRALGPDAGAFWSPRRIWDECVSYGVEPSRVPNENVTLRRLVVVASHRDYRRTAGPVVMLEHGAGQSYAQVDIGANPGGAGRDRVVLFLHPSETVAARDARAYPCVRSVAVGSPRLDELARIPQPRSGVVAFTWHWDGQYSPEARGDWRRWAHAVEVMAQVMPVLVHAHPRIRWEVERWTHESGLDFAADFREVVARADILACDNSSAMFEWAALERPVVVLDQPWYGPDDAHPHPWPLRRSLGPVCAEPNHLAAAVEQARHDDGERRRRAIAHVYPPTDGLAAQRAADEIRKVACGADQPVRRT